MSESGTRIIGFSIRNSFKYLASKEFMAQNEALADREEL